MTNDDHPDAHPKRDPGLTEVGPELVRLGAVTGVRALGWTARASLSVTERVVRGVREGESPGELLANGGHELRGYARKVLGVPDDDGAGSPGAAHPPVRRNGNGNGNGTGSGVVLHKGGDADSLAALRRRGAELLARSADVTDDDLTHPAYARILDELAPDEARVLRHMCKTGPQAAVDVRTNKLPLKVGSQLVEPGLTMIGQEAGLRHIDQLHAYLNNLFRLGLIWFSREPLPSPLDYQVLEAQPDVVAALRKEGRAKTVRRSILLTPFGTDFCRVCLPS